MEITEVKRVFLTQSETGWSSPKTLSTEIDLGLGIDQAAVIERIHLYSVHGVDTDQEGYQLAECQVWFDPEQSSYKNDDDEIIAELIHYHQQLGTTLEQVFERSRQREFNFIGQNLVTVRNLAFVVRIRASLSTPQEWDGAATIFYHRFKPSQGDLNMLIATRR